MVALCVLGVAWWQGVNALRNGRRYAWWVGGVGLALVALTLPLAWGAMPVTPWTWRLAPLEKWVAHAPAVGLTLGCAGIVRSRVLRAGLLGVGAFLSLHVSYLLVLDGLLLSNFYGLNTDRQDSAHHQSTSWSCTPAAAAFVFEREGIKISEYEAAVRCHTGPLSGTSHHGLLAAFYAVGLRPHMIENVSWEDIERAPKPLIASITLPTGIRHSVVVLDVVDGRAQLHDPLVGARSSVRKTLEQQSMGYAVYAER